MVMKIKEQLLKPRVLENIDRLRKIVELDAPPVLIGEFAFSLYATVLAAYGEEAGRAMAKSIRDHNLQDRAVCDWGDCTNTVERTPIGTCPDCQKEIGCDPESLAEIDAIAEKLAGEWKELEDGQ